jgi:hypothetical protein
MDDALDFADTRTTRNRVPGDQYDADLDERLRRGDEALQKDGLSSDMDGAPARAELRQLLEWYFLEREKQAQNRLEMATDCDFYDNLQWDAEDAQTLRDRGQMPLVYNEVAPMVDWLIGTERRARVDWRVLPRTEDDVQAADVKTKVLKYVSDINRVVFHRSAAFADSIKAGVGWLDDGTRDDPTADILYSRREDWRNVLWDSSSYELDLSDARYLFRWRWVDLDVAVAMFPQRAAQIRMAAEDNAAFRSGSDEEETWASPLDEMTNERTGRIYASGSGVMVDARRRRVKLIEAQYRKPMPVKIVTDGPHRGAIYTESDAALGEHVRASGAQLLEKVMMRVHGAVFTDSHMLAYGPGVARHNRFTLTPVWCYRRGRDRLPYGVIRRVRDIQQDLNKRASKALFMLNTNQVIADDDATDDWEELRDEVDRPDGLIKKKKGSQVEIRRDTDAATGQIQMMTLAAQSIQKSAGVADENLGRQTNAVSGEAIKARQLQGSVVTTEPLDNLRYATQIQGEKQLSLTEQFYTQEKVIRLTGAKGALEWVKINVPELADDGAVRILNDVTASMADFVVSEQDYAGTLRQVMFDSMNQLAQKLPPEIGMRFLRIAFEFSDLPNKDEIAEELRRLTGERDPNKEMTPEEAQQAEEQMRMQSEQLQLQRETAFAALEEQRAKVRELNARAMELEARAAAAGQEPGGMPPEVEAALAESRKAQGQAADQIDKLSHQLAKAQSEMANRTMQIKSDSDAKRVAAQIDADAKVRVAEIQQASDQVMTGLLGRMDDMAKLLDEAARRADEALSKQEQAQKALVQMQAEAAAREKVDADANKAKPAAEPAAKPAPAPLPPPPPITVNVQVDATQGPVVKTVTLERDADGKVKGGTVKEAPAEKGGVAK